MSKFTPVLLVATILLAFAVGVLWTKVSNLEKGKTPNTTGNVAGEKAPAPDGKLTEEQVKKVEKVTDSDHIRGNKDAEVVVIEYADFECPFCEKFHPTAKQALEKYGDKIAWIFRHFPLDSIHSRARPAANAAECVASLKGNDAFWKFVDTVFSNQEKYLADLGLTEAAVAAGAEKGEFETCLKANKFDSVISNDQKGGEAAGVTGTPASFVINKKGEMWLIPGALPYESLKSTIDEALQ